MEDVMIPAPLAGRSDGGRRSPILGWLMLVTDALLLTASPSLGGDGHPSNQKPMNIVLVKAGKVELRNRNGGLVRTVGNGDAVMAELSPDGSHILITTLKGKVEFRKESGSLVRTIGNGDARSARFSGEDILIATEKGRNELRTVNGSLIRVL